MTFIREMLSEQEGVSCVRIMALVCVATSAAVSIVGVLKGTDPYGLSTLVGTILGAAFTGKVVQKKYEKKD